MPIGTAVHERVMQLCESLSFREWSGYYAASVYETHHEHEYNAIRNAAAMIDVSPLFKYRDQRAGRGEVHQSRHHARHHRVAVGQVIYCCWCDEQGKMIDDGTISRLAENTYRWTDGRTKPALVSPEFARPGREDRRHFGRNRGTGDSGPDFRAACCRLTPALKSPT